MKTHQEDVRAQVSKTVLLKLDNKDRLYHLGWNLADAGEASLACMRAHDIVPQGLEDARSKDITKIESLKRLPVRCARHCA
jgi:hypothetical protein